MPRVLMLSTSRPTGQRKVSWLTSGTIGYSHQVSKVSLSDHRLTLWRKWEKKRNLLVVIYLLESRTNISERGQRKHLESGTIASSSGIDAKKSPIFIFDVNYSLTIFISRAATRNTVSANRLLSSVWTWPRILGKPKIVVRRKIQRPGLRSRVTVNLKKKERHWA